MSRKIFDDWDDYEDLGAQGGYTKLSKSSKRKQHELENIRRPKRGHHRAPMLDWEIIDDAAFEVEEAAPRVAPTPPPVECAPAPAAAPADFDPNATSFGVPKKLTELNTRTVKGNDINYDRVIDIRKIENDHNGRLTYGIKFVFRGTNAQRELSRIAWFNVNQTERDRLYTQELNFWQSLQGDRKDNK